MNTPTLIRRNQYNAAMLDKRSQLLLKTLVERYIAEGQPVGSRTLSKYSALAGIRVIRLQAGNLIAGPLQRLPRHGLSR